MCFPWVRRFRAWRSLCRLERGLRAGQIRDLAADWPFGLSNRGSTGELVEAVPQGVSSYFLRLGQARAHAQGSLGRRLRIP
eukprot:166622-Pleurochrysis_carterae.AAC.1